MFSDLACKSALILSLLIACGDNDKPEQDQVTCTQSLTAFYNAGCAFFNLDGTEVLLSENIQQCQAFADSIDGDSPCELALETYLVCLDSAVLNDCEACVFEQQALAETACD